MLEQDRNLVVEHILVDKCRKIGIRVGHSTAAAWASSSSLISLAWDAISYSNPSNLPASSVLSWLELAFL
jgi:hypothetical protein